MKRPAAIDVTTPKKMYVPALSQPAMIPALGPRVAPTKPYTLPE